MVHDNRHFYARTIRKTCCIRHHRTRVIKAAALVDHRSDFGYSTGVIRTIFLQRHAVAQLHRLVDLLGDAEFNL